MSEPFKLISARAAGLIDDPDTTLDPLPGNAGYSVIDATDCAEHDAAIAVLRAENARLRNELATLRAERLTFAQRAEVLDADEMGRDEADRSGPDDDIALRLVASEERR